MKKNKNFWEQEEFVTAQKCLTAGLIFTDLIQTKRAFEAGKKYFGADDAHLAEGNPIMRLLIKKTGFNGFAMFKTLTAISPFITEGILLHFLTLFYTGVVSWNGYVLNELDKKTK